MESTAQEDDREKSWNSAVQTLLQSGSSSENGTDAGGNQSRQQGLSKIYQLLSYHVQVNEQEAAQFPPMLDVPFFFDDSNLLLVYVKQQELRAVNCCPSVASPDSALQTEEILRFVPTLQMNGALTFCSCCKKNL